MPLKWKASYGTLAAEGVDHHFVVCKDDGRYVCLFHIIGGNHGLVEVPGPYTTTKRQAQNNAEHFEQEYARLGLS